MNLKTPLFFSLFFAVFLISVPLFAEIRLPAIFGNNMVLQQQSDVAIWGTANKNATVEIITSWNKKTYSTKASDDGRWKLKISTPQAGGPYNLIISDGQILTLENVLIGEVWVCSGQSNMQMPMKGFNNQPIIGSLDAILESLNPSIRFFSVGLNASLTPLDDFKGKWDNCDQETTEKFSATAYFFGRLLQKTLNVPIGLIHPSWGGTAVQTWMSEGSCKEFDFIKMVSDPSFPKNPPKAPASLFNAMINPMVGYGIRGAIWYQGESNKTEPENYQKMFPAMIKDWRTKWEVGDFPFYFVQIAPHAKNDVLPNGAFLREAQLKTLTTTTNVGMACALDVGEQFNIHPANKEILSKRLAYMALSKTYNIKGFNPNSPVFKAMTIKSDTVRITFENAPLGLTSFGKELSLFELAGEDKVFHPAKATINPNGIMLKSSSVALPVAVRYAFKNFVVGDLFGTNGLPVSSFRTDDWEREK
jgi:sialate O-acetylesterase